MDPNLREIIISILAIIGGGGVVIRGIFDFFGKRYLRAVDARYERDIERIQNSHSNELEILRSALTEKRDLLNGLIGISAQQQNYAFEKIVEAQSVLWKRILEIREFCIRYLLIYSILLPEEYNDVFSRPNLKHYVPNDSIDEFDYKMMEIMNKDIEIWRPFLGEKLWLYYFIYRAFLFRQATKVNRGYNDHNIKAWDINLIGEGRDDFFNQVLSPILSTEEIKQYIVPGSLAGPHKLIDALELKILSEMNFMLFGRYTMETNFQHYKALLLLKDQELQTRVN